MIKAILYIIVLVLSLFGVIFLGNIVHEYSHYQDLGKYANEDELCVMILPTNASNMTWKDWLSMHFGYYKYKFDVVNLSEVNSVRQWTEYKAYFIEFLLFLLFIFAFFETIKSLRKVSYYA